MYNVINIIMSTMIEKDTVKRIIKLNAAVGNKKSKKPNKGKPINEDK